MVENIEGERIPNFIPSSSGLPASNSGVVDWLKKSSLHVHLFLFFSRLPLSAFHIASSTLVSHIFNFFVAHCEHYRCGIPFTHFVQN